MTISDAARKMREGGAYRMFVSETEKYMESASVFDATVLPPADCKTWSMRFHTIKGGAGFFQLTEIADVSGLLERDLVAPNVHEIWGKILENVGKLRVLVATMPRPSQPAS